MRVLHPNVIRDARLLRGWTQHQLGVLCGVSQQAIQRVEAGDLKAVRPEVARELVRNLDLDLEVTFEHVPAIPAPRTRPSSGQQTRAAS